MSRRIPIRTKLAAALAVPLVALLTVAALEVVQSRQEREQVKEQTALATSSIGPTGLITSLMNERNYAGAYLLGLEERLQLPVTDLDQAQAETDEALTTFRDEVASKGGDVARAYGHALDGLDRLAEYRQFVSTYDGPRTLETVDEADFAFDGYTELIDQLFTANSRIAVAVNDAELRQGVQLTLLASRQIDTFAQLVSELLVGSVTVGLDDPETQRDAGVLYGDALRNLDDIRSLGTGPYRDITERLIAESTELGFLDVVDETLVNREIADPDVLLGAVSAEDDESYYGFRARVAEKVESRADELMAAATAKVWWFTVLAGLALLVAVSVTLLVSWSITRPLRSLTRQAKEMAERRLPDAVLDVLETPLGEDVEVPEVEPVVVRTRDEVADVAEALNTVQDSALELAVEQAVLRRNIADSFVNLGRRNQNLLGRQLDFITELEANETDPDTLANLFRLDHLATRMRRNAESLLVLAGVEPPRKWAAPVRLTDVIRAALGEVEDYQRVTVRGVEPATVQGSDAADLAHLLAELIENALVFSPPDQAVDIRGRNRPDGGYTLAIIDSGLGMAPEDIAAANRRLAGAESFTIAPSKYLGHYVAGNLAVRHGIQVRLERSPGSGITAMVELPPEMLTREVDDLSGTHPHAGVDPSAPAAHLAPPPSAPWAGAPVPGHQDAAAATWPVSGASLDDQAWEVSPQAPALPARTASGLVKRAPRAAAPSAHLLDETLLASLSRVARQNLGSATADGAAGPPTAGERWPTARPAAQQGGGTPHAPRSDGASPVSRPSGPPPGPLGSTGAAEPTTSDSTDQTASGLVRRVRGAQLPNTQAPSLRRGKEHRATGGDYGHAWHDGGDGRDSVPGDTNGRWTDPTTEEPSSARDVYSFLTSFTAGVQRGLDESRRGPTTPEDDS